MYAHLSVLHHERFDLAVFDAFLCGDSFQKFAKNAKADLSRKKRMKEGVKNWEMSLKKCILEV